MQWECQWRIKRFFGDTVFSGAGEGEWSGDEGGEVLELKSLETQSNIIMIFKRLYFGFKHVWVSLLELFTMEKRN